MTGKWLVDLGSASACEPRGRAGMLPLEFPRHGAGSVLCRRKRACMGERYSQSDNRPGSRHRFLMPNDPNKQDREHHGAEYDAERGLHEIAARRYSRELPHDEL